MGREEEEITNVIGNNQRINGFSPVNRSPSLKASLPHFPGFDAIRARAADATQWPLPECYQCKIAGI